MAELKKIQELFAEIQDYDFDTGIHCKNVQHYATYIGTQLLTEEEQETLKAASLLHDIGKIFVPLSILLKPGKLTEKERECIKYHPSFGAMYLKEHGIPLEIVLCVLQHHEHMNGTGYPYHLYNRQIMTSAKILQVADVYDALAHDRPYRKAMPKEHIIKILEQKKYYVPAAKIMIAMITEDEKI